MHTALPGVVGSGTELGDLQQWYFSVVDVADALTDFSTPRQYWGRAKQTESL